MVRKTRSTKKVAGEALIYFLLSIGGVVILFPVLWAALSSLKPAGEIFTMPVALFPKKITLGNYVLLANTFPLLRLVFNTFLYAGVVTISSFLFATITGYGFAKFRNRVTDIIFTVLLTGLMVPFFIRLIPLYTMMVKIGGQNTYWGLILPNYISIFGIFLIKQYAVTIPNELMQAPRIDGASEPVILFKIFFPLIKPAGFTLATIKFITTWNDFLWPVVMLSARNKMTLPIAVATFVDPMTQVRYGPILAGAVIMLIPVSMLFLILQKQVVRGIAMSGFKG